MYSSVLVASSIIVSQHTYMNSMTTHGNLNNITALHYIYVKSNIFIVNIVENLKKSFSLLHLIFLVYDLELTTLCWSATSSLATPSHYAN